jgi:hypothetical protein
MTDDSPIFAERKLLGDSVSREKLSSALAPPRALQ